MDYEFRDIEFLIRDAIDSVRWSKLSLQELFVQTRKQINEEKQRIEKHFAPRVISFANPALKTPYVQFHQRSLISFIDELFYLYHLSINKKSRRENQLAMEVFFFYDQLEGILNYIQDQLPEYFDMDAKVPESKKSKLCCSIKCKYSAIHGLLVDELSDQSLLSICLNPIDKMLSGLDHRITYRQVFYVESLMQDLQRIVENRTDVRVWEDKIRAILIYLNYNSKDFFDYYTNLIKKDLPETESGTDELKKLAFYYKTINQSPQKPESIYDPKLRSIIDQLTDWILQEMHYMEKKKELHSNQQTRRETLMQIDFKLEFDMSVSQFAYFIKAFIETGVIQNKNTSEMIRFLSKSVKTKRSENISDESFRNKYYNVENTTKASVRNFLLSAIKYINRN